MSGKADPEPMDPRTPERAVGEAAQTQSRPCYAAKQLVAEVLELFPETPYEFSKPNARGVNLAVTFVSAETDFLKFLPLLTDDRLLRIVGTPSDDGMYEIEAEFRNSARTQDLRDPFGLSEAWMVYSDECPHPTITADCCDQCGAHLPPLDGADPNYGDDTEPTEGGSAAETSADSQDGGGA